MAYTQTIEAINRLVATGIVPGVSYAILDGKLQTKGIVGAEQLVPAYEPLKKRSTVRRGKFNQGGGNCSGRIAIDRIGRVNFKRSDFAIFSWLVGQTSDDSPPFDPYIRHHRLYSAAR